MGTGNAGYFCQLNCPALPSLLIVSSVVYPRLILNHDFNYFSLKKSTYLTQNFKTNQEHSRGSPEFPPNQNIIQIGPGFMNYDRTYKQTEITTLFIQIRFLYSYILQSIYSQDEFQQYIIKDINIYRKYIQLSVYLFQ